LTYIFFLVLVFSGLTEFFDASVLLSNINAEAAMMILIFLFIFIKLVPVFQSFFKIDTALTTLQLIFCYHQSMIY